MKKFLDADVFAYLPARPKTTWPDRLQQAAVETFAVLLAGEIGPASTHAGRYDGLIAIVGLTGAISGSLSVRCSCAAGWNIAVRMVGVPEPSEEQIRVSLGELAHRIARTLRKATLGPARECLISSPTFASNDEEACNPFDETFLTVFEFHGFPIWIRFSIYP